MAITTNYQTAPVQNTNNTQAAQTAQTPAQLAARRADQVLGAQTVAAPVASAPVGGSDAMKAQMEKAGMSGVHSPPQDAELRTYYSNYAPHHELIAKGDYKAAAAAYAKDAETSDNQARLSAQATQEQLEFASKMGGGKVSFPPTHEEAKAHFATLKGKDDEIKKDYSAYTHAFYQHVGQDQESIDKGVKDVNYTPHKLPNGKISTAPTGADDVRDNAQLNNRGRRVIDCEGYVQLGQDLLGAAGYTQPTVHRATDAKHPGNTGHVMLEMKDSTGQPLIVNNQYIQNERQAYGSQPGVAPLWRRLGCERPEDLQVNKGRSLDNATMNQIQGTHKYKPNY